MDKLRPSRRAQQPPGMELAGISEENVPHYSDTNSRATHPLQDNRTWALRTAARNRLWPRAYAAATEGSTGGVTTDIRVFYIGRQLVVLGIIAGQADCAGSEGFPERVCQSAYCCGSSTDADFLGSSTPTRSGWSITADALMAGYGLLQLHPKHLRRLLAGVAPCTESPLDQSRRSSVTCFGKR